MIFRPFYYFDRGCASYLFGCGSLGRCAVVDPRADDVDSYVAFASSKNMRITHVIDTHVHADHRSGGPELARRTDAAYCLHESADYKGPFNAVREGERIELGNTHITVLHTPGHSPESICLLVTDLKRGAEPWFVLTGDTLFVGAVGRRICRGERENALRTSMQASEKAAHVADEIEVIQAISRGRCGQLERKPMSTIAFERRWNPMLSRDKQAFVEALADVPPKPDDMEQILSFNRGRQVKTNA
jgi:glyoxylase-like metal-dependent hydrolase (beta-lactamase superfamily II)